MDLRSQSNLVVARYRCTNFVDTNADLEREQKEQLYTLSCKYPLATLVRQD